MERLKKAFKISGESKKSEERPPHGSEEEVYRCITCGARISKREFEENEGQCDTCVVEDTVYAAPEEFGF